MVDDDKHIVLTHQKLLEELFCTVYYTSTPDDLNRAGDGVALRARYVMLTHDTGDEIEGWLEGECSILELLVAFASRIETDYMNEFKLGDRTYKWFWTFLGNLDLDWMTDRRFSKEIVDDHVLGFLTRSGNRKNGTRPYWLFWPKIAPLKVANSPLWDQMMVWISENTPPDKFKIG